MLYSLAMSLRENICNRTVQFKSPAISDSTQKLGGAVFSCLPYLLIHRLSQELPRTILLELPPVVGSGLCFFYLTE